jgi:DNA-binding MarR family transcriptional regulator
MSVTPIGTSADVEAARRALHAKFEPSLLLYAAWGAVFALFYGSKSLPLILVAAVTLATASVAATWWHARRMRRVHPRRIRLFSRGVFLLTSLLGLIGLFVAMAIIVVATAASLHWWSWAVSIAHCGTPMSYLLPFVVFMAPVIAAATLPWLIDPYGIDARAMRKTPDQPAAGDPLIAPRQQTMVCAMLAGVDSIEARFLAKALRMDGDELHRQIAELVAAQYIDVYPHYGRRWFGLTAVGRSAYRRHLRALVSTELPTVADRVL